MGIDDCESLAEAAVGATPVDPGVLAGARHRDVTPRCFNLPRYVNGSLFDLNIRQYRGNFNLNTVP
jgi:hypothetical protein